jgi:ribosomal-protein-alanine N-acetyltransferase
MTPFAIRPMEPADLAAVLSVAALSSEAPQWQAYSYSYYLLANPEPPLLRAAFVAVSDPADSEPAVLGFAAMSLVRDGDLNLCELDSMAVHPSARRQGIAAALLRAILVWADQHGARKLALEVRAGNTAAIRLYERFGMQREGHRTRYYSHPEEDALLLGMAVTTVLGSPSFSTEKEVEGGPPQC